MHNLMKRFVVFKKPVTAWKFYLEVILSFSGTFLKQQSYRSLVERKLSSVSG